MYDITYLQQVATQARLVKKQLEDELKSLNDKMYEVACLGYETVDFYHAISPLAIDYLQKNGFKVVSKECPATGPFRQEGETQKYFTISWFSK